MKCPMPKVCWGRLACLLVVSYALTIGWMFFFQRDLMYHPTQVPFDPAAHGITGAQKIETPIEGGKLAHFMTMPAAEGKPTLVFFQGNADGLARRAFKFRDWQGRGYGLLMVGYPGFDNPGKPSEESLYEAGRAAIAAWASLTGLKPEKALVYYGESLGTGIATQMALDIKPMALILEAPYTAFADVGAVHYPYLPVRWLIKDHYRTIDKIASVGVPLLVIHGTDDETVPFEQGHKVFETAQEPKTSFFPAMAHHNDLFDFGAGDEVARFLSEGF